MFVRHSSGLFRASRGKKLSGSMDTLPISSTAGLRGLKSAGNIVGPKRLTSQNLHPKLGSCQKI